MCRVFVLQGRLRLEVGESAISDLKAVTKIGVPNIYNRLMFTRIKIPLLLALFGSIMIFASRDRLAYLLSNFGFVLLNHALAQAEPDLRGLQTAEFWLNRAERVEIGQVGAGLAFHEQGKYAEALIKWHAAGVAPEFLLGWGKHMWAEGRQQDALVWLRYASEIAPSNAEILYWRGRAYQATGQTQDAQAQLQRASELAPDIRDIWYELAQTFQAQGEWQLALQSLENATNAAETYGTVGFSNVLYEIGFIRQHHLKPTDSEGAWKAYEKALDARDFAYKLWQESNTYFQRGLLLADLHKWEAARNEYAAALALNPKAYYLRISYAHALRQLGLLLEAKQMLRQAITIQPDGFEAMTALGDIYRAENNLDAAREWYAKAAAIVPQNRAVLKRIWALESDKLER